MAGATASAETNGGGRRSDLCCFFHEVLRIDPQVAATGFRERLLVVVRRALRPVGARLRDGGMGFNANADVIAAHLVVDMGVAERLEPFVGPGATGATQVSRNAAVAARGEVGDPAAGAIDNDRNGVPQCHEPN